MSVVQRPITIKSWGGIDNVSPTGSAAENRFQEMTSVEILNSGAVKRAQGCRVISAGSGRHSAFSDGQHIHFRENTGLYRLEHDGSTTLLDNGFTTAGGRVTYYQHFDRTFYSDNLKNGVIQNGAARSWGLTPPPLPTVANDIGDLIHGRYHIGITYIRNDGQESGTSGLAAVDCTGGLRIRVAPSSDSTVAYIGVYITSAGGDVPYLQAKLANEWRQFRIGSGVGSGRPIDTNLCSAPLPCSAIAEYRGRLYMAVGPNLFFSRSGNQYELVEQLDRSFLPFAEDITNILPVDDGLWVTTVKHSMFIQGTDPHEGGGFVVKFKQKINGKKRSGQSVDADVITSRVLMQGRLAVWTSDSGVCFGGPGGYFKNITGGYFHPNPSVNGMSFARSHSNLDQYFFGVLASDLVGRMVLPAITMNHTS